MGNINKMGSLCKCCPNKKIKSYDLLLNDFDEPNELDSILYTSEDNIEKCELKLFDTIDLTDTSSIIIN